MKNELVQAKQNSSTLEQALESLLVWYPSHARALPWRQDKNPYHVWLSEIMLQQTRVEAVKGYYARFLSELPDIEALAKVDEEKLLKLWEGLGYYNRARNLKKAAQTIMEEYDGVFPEKYEQIRALSGIGDYTAGAIGSICYELETPAVDGNVLRVYARLLEMKDSIDQQKTKKQVAEELAKHYHAGQCGITTQSLMELGATVCVPNGAPHCTECPLNSVCKAKANGTISQYPVRDEKKKRKQVKKTVFVLQFEDTFAIVKRPAKGLLAGLWEFPCVETELDEQQAISYLEMQGFGIQTLHMKSNYKHIFSHVEWDMQAYYLTCNHVPAISQSDTIKWISLAELDEQYSLPSAYKPFRDLLPLKL